jgi:molybdate transport system permease protein
VDASFPVLLSFRVAVAAMAIAGPLGLAIAWVQAKHRYALRWVVDALVLLPLVLPPTVVGYILVISLGRRGVFGQVLDRAFGIRLVFTPTAAVIASKTAQPALEAVPGELENVGRTLGLAPLALLARVTLPAAWRGVVAAVALGFARAAGEFGATVMFAGDTPGRTNTMPIEIFAASRAGEYKRAFLYVLILAFASVAIVTLAALLTPRDPA